MATSWAYAASASEPATRSLMVEPDAYSAPPTETWMIPSLSASAKPWSAAVRVEDDVTLTAGKANLPAFARSIISV